MRGGSPRSYPALRRRKDGLLVFAPSGFHKSTAFIGLVVFAAPMLFILLRPFDIEGPWWWAFMLALFMLSAAVFFYVEAFRRERLAIDLNTRRWSLRRGVFPLSKSHSGRLDGLSHLSLESRPWQMEGSPAFRFWTVWLNFKAPGIKRYCLGARPRGLEDLDADHETQARELLANYAAMLGLRAIEAPSTGTSGRGKR